GPIYIQQTGNVVVAVESFDPENADRLIQLGLKQAEEGLAQNAQPHPRFGKTAAPPEPATLSAPSVAHH
ncbi:MAG TPA: hypothetical protein VFY05_06725, partial [Candidatus Angelobacter sp.]|nr:hypothetical protein [Candidatus Angelobacter sp.]